MVHKNFTEAGLVKMSRGIKICLGLCFLISTVCLLERNYAQEQENKEVKKAVKKITGQVSFINKDFISIIYKREDDHSKEYEMVMYIDRDVILRNIRDRDLENLNEQDVVQIEYVQIDTEQSSKRVAKRIRFVRGRKAPLKLKGFKNKE